MNNNVTSDNSTTVLISCRRGSPELVNVTTDASTAATVTEIREHVFRAWELLVDLPDAEVKAALAEYLAAFYDWQPESLEAEMDVRERMANFAALTGGAQS